MTTAYQAPRLSRREAIRAGVLTGAASALAPWTTAAAQQPAPLLTRPIPSTGEKLPVIGLGANAYGVSAPDDIAARREVLQRMPELGATVVDTAANYGRSEEVIGGVVRELGVRDRLFIATKFMEETAEAGRASVEASFRKLQTNRIDLMQAHNLRGVEPMMPILQELKAAKRIRYIGVTTSSVGQHAELAALMRKYRFDFVQVNYSIDDREAAAKILPLARDRGAAVLLNVPFGGRRGSLFPRVAGKPLPPLAAELGARTWAQFLLKYSLSHPAVTCAIPGMTQLRHLEDNIQAGRGKLADAAQRRKMETYWESLAG